MAEWQWRDRITHRQTYRKATQSSTNPTCPGLRSNEGFSGNGPANGRLAAQCLRVLVWPSLRVTCVAPASVLLIPDFWNKKFWTPHFIHIYMEANLAWMEELSSRWPHRRRKDDGTCIWTETLQWVCCTQSSDSTAQLKCDGTRRRTVGEVKGKLANGVGSQYSSHYLGTWCIQHYYRWCAHLGCH